MDIGQARAAFLAHRPFLMERGIRWQPGCEPYGYVSSDPARGVAAGMAMDALPTLGTDPNSGILGMFTTWVDPETYRWVFAPLRAVDIIGPERRTGDWTEQTAVFPVVEIVGETTAYGDYNNSGENSGNANFPQRQSFLFQTIIEYGDLEVDRYARARINWISEKQRSRIRQLSTFMNYSYFFGIAGLQNYGLLNDPNLPASIGPAVKAKTGGTTWLSGTQVVATANEIFNDIQATVIQGINQNAGVVDRESEMVLALDPAHEAALTATNSFNVNVSDLLKKNFPKMKVVSATQYGTVSGGQIVQGQASLALMQLIFPEVEGMRTGFPAFNEKLRAHRVIFDLSAAKQKMTSGTFGTVLRYTAGIASMTGI